MSRALVTLDLTGLQQAIADAVRDAVREAFAAEKEAAPAPPPELLSRSETRSLLHISNTTLHAWEKKGLLIPSRAGRRVLFRRSDIDRLLEGKGRR